MTKKHAYFWLILINIVGFLIIQPYEFFPDSPSNTVLDFSRFSLPGALFSIFVTILTNRKWAIKRVLATFFGLFIFYCTSLLLCFSTWGLTVPVVGSIGALLVKKSSFFNDKLLDENGKKLALNGFLSGLTGLILFYIGINFFLNDGASFGLIIFSWQIPIGLFLIKKICDDKQAI